MANNGGGLWQHWISHCWPLTLSWFTKHVLQPTMIVIIIDHLVFFINTYNEICLTILTISTTNWCLGPFCRIMCGTPSRTWDSMRSLLETPWKHAMAPWHPLCHSWLMLIALVIGSWLCQTKVVRSKIASVLEWLGLNGCWGVSINRGRQNLWTPNWSPSSSALR